MSLKLHGLRDSEVRMSHSFFIFLDIKAAYFACIRVLHEGLCHNPDNNSLGFHLEDCVFILKS